MIYHIMEVDKKFWEEFNDPTLLQILTLESRRIKEDSEMGESVARTGR